MLFENKSNTKQKKTILLTRNGPKRLVKDILNWHLIKNSQIYSPYTPEEIASHLKGDVSIVENYGVTNDFTIYIRKIDENI